MSCSGNCNSCNTSCSSDTRTNSMIESLNQFSKVKKVIGVVSGKGGVGKSLTTSYLSVLMNRKGYNTAILDADMTGPSIPKTFGIREKATGNDLGMFPATSEKGIKVMSVNLLLEEEEMPVVWRGPVIASTVKQFWTDVIWEDVDYMFIDMPPGTGDVPLTVFQSIPVDGIIIVTSPQELVSMIVGKAVNMAKAMNVPIIGLVENYSYIACGSCGDRISVFGESRVEEVGNKYNIKVLNKVPIDPVIAKAVDTGSIESLEIDYYDETAKYIEEFCQTATTQSTRQCIGVSISQDEEVVSVTKATKIKVYKIEGTQLIEEKIVENDESKQIVELLQEEEVTAFLCGGLSLDTMNALHMAGIQVYPGCKGDVNVAVASFIEESTYTR